MAIAGLYIKGGLGVGVAEHVTALCHISNDLRGTRYEAFQKQEKQSRLAFLPILVTGEDCPGSQIKGWGNFLGACLDPSAGLVEHNFHSLDLWHCKLWHCKLSPPRLNN